MDDKEIAAIYHELNFWKEFVQWNRFIKGWIGPEKTPELNDFVAQFILDRPHDAVLDVGSGPASILAGLIPKENLTAVDPLGDLYQLIFDYDDYGIVPPIAMSGESIRYAPVYDIVHMSNAIDHTAHPLGVYRNLFNAVKPGGCLIIQGFEYEARKNKGQGFHQWDIYVDDNKLWLEKNQNRDCIAADSIVSKRIKTIDNRDWFIWIAQK